MHILQKDIVKVIPERDSVLFRVLGFIIGGTCQEMLPNRKNYGDPISQVSCCFHAIVLAGGMPIV